MCNSSVDVNQRLYMFYDACGKLRDRETSVTVEMKLFPTYLCPSCGTAVARNQRFCRVCVVRLNALNEATTVTRAPDHRSTFSAVVSDANFPPGAVLAQIISAPRRVKGEAITTLADVYSLGVVLYELLTGHRPYDLLSVAMYEIARVISEEEPTRP